MARADARGGAAQPSAALSPRVVAGAIIAAGFGVSLLVNLPGHLTYDSVVQLLQGRMGIYTNWHPPVMAWLLGVGDTIVPGAALFVTFVALLAFGALLSIVLLPGRPSWLTVAVAALFVTTPNLLLFSGIVWKDVLFAASATAGFVALAHAAARWDDKGIRIGLLAVAALLLALATLTRQNGGVVLPCAAVAIGWVAWRAGNPPRLRGAFVNAAAWLAATAAILLAGGAALQTRALHTAAVRGLMKDTQSFDIVGMVDKEASLELTRFDEAAPKLAELIRTKGAPGFYAGNIGSIKRITDLSDAIAATPSTLVSEQWRDIVIAHPLLYLKHRAAAFSHLVRTDNTLRCIMYRTGVSGSEQWMAMLGIAPRYDRRDELLGRYAYAWLYTPAFSHVTYIVAAIAIGVALLLRRRPTDIVIAAMLASALAFTAALFPLVVACDYRYIYYVDLATIAAILYVTLGGRPRLST